MKIIHIHTIALNKLPQRDINRLLHNLQLPKGGGEPMPTKKKGMTKNQKLKKLKTSKLKKAVKSKK